MAAGRLRRGTDLPRRGPCAAPMGLIFLPLIVFRPRAWWAAICRLLGTLGITPRISAINARWFDRPFARPYIRESHDMSWLEQKIRRYEHARWTTDDNRRVYPFEWGLEHIGGRSDEPDPRGFLNTWVEETLAHSDEWFSTT